jgi:hypothetical protein
VSQQQLRVLRDSGFTSVRANGARRIYSVDAGRLREVDDWLDKFRTFWGPHLDALATEIARGKRKRRRQGRRRLALERSSARLFRHSRAG